MIQRISKYINKESNPYPLAVYRIGFGLLVMFSIIRFWYNGWIESLYLEPGFHFSFLGFFFEK